MNTITVNTTKSYNVIVGNDLLHELGQHAVKVCKPQKVAIISDSHVWPLYGAQTKESLEKAGLHTCNFVFPAGENSKNGETYLSILNFLANNHLSRTDLLIALGGGVVGDITGFAAATYLRGVSYIQVPTTLLAMVDSSVGGKTAIDLAAGKNLAGAFYQPNLVLCDIHTLDTLPVAIFRDGCAEVIKYGVLYDEDLFSHLLENGLSFDRKRVVTRCIELKRNVVVQDEFDLGLRQKLNLGHTIGHGIEAKSNLTVSHGQAVAAGISIVTKAGYKNDICNKETYHAIISVLTQFGLPTATIYTAEDLYTCALSDKKRMGGTVNLIVPQEIGNCIIQPTDISDLKSFIEAGL